LCTIICVINASVHCWWNTFTRWWWTIMACMCILQRILHYKPIQA
jgi:hypothetical protein